MRRGLKVDGLQIKFEQIHGGLRGLSRSHLAPAAPGCGRILNSMARVYTSLWCGRPHSVRISSCTTQ